MKKILILIAAMVCMGNFLFAQNEASFTPKKNELSLNLPIAIFFSFPEISYEYILAEDMGVGASTAFGINDKKFLKMKFMTTPYVRWYFAGSMESEQKYASRFFVEANMSLFKSEKKDKKETGFGLGLATGWKFVTRGNWVAQVYGGLGKNLIDGVAIYPRFSVSVGKRF